MKTRLKNFTYTLHVHILDADIQSVYRRGNGDVYRKKTKKLHYKVVSDPKERNVWISDGTADEKLDPTEEVLLLQEPIIYVTKVRLYIGLGLWLLFIITMLFIFSNIMPGLEQKKKTCRNDRF